LIRKIVLLLLVVAATSVGSAVTLVENPYTTFADLPIYALSCSILLHGTPDAYWVCLTTHGTDAVPVTNAQSITVEDSWGAVSGISFYMKRAATCAFTCNNDPNLYLKVYKSPTTSFADAYLWDTGIYNPANTDTFQQFTFTFDADIPIYNEFDEKIVQSLWIVLQQSPLNLSNVDSSRFVEVVFSDDSTDRYPGGILYQSYDSSTYTEFNYPYNVNYAFDYFRTDLSFKLYGTFHIPQTPVPPPIITDPNGTQTITLPDGCTWSDFYNNACSNLPDVFWTGSTQYTPDYNYSSNNMLLNNTTIGLPNNAIGNKPLPAQLLKGAGYCSSTGCTIEDVFDLLYDIAQVLIVLSFIYVLYVCYTFISRK
jgi:hypothetical protein